MLRLVLPIAISCCTLPAQTSERIEGEIALSAPACELFVVQTNRGFSLLVEHDYYSVFEGDKVRGMLHAPGSQEVEIVGEIALEVTVEGWALNLQDAKQIFYPRCRRP